MEATAVRCRVDSEIARGETRGGRRRLVRGVSVVTGDGDSCHVMMEADVVRRACGHTPCDHRAGPRSAISRSCPGSSVDRASDFGSEGRGFKSLPGCHVIDSHAVGTHAPARSLSHPYRHSYCNGRGCSPALPRHQMTGRSGRITRSSWGRSPGRPAPLVVRPARSPYIRARPRETESVVSSCIRRASPRVPPTWETRGRDERRSRAHAHG